jgi:hypothetical protein
MLADGADDEGAAIEDLLRRFERLMPPTASTQQDRQLLAFVHIEKSAGTSMIHLLRRNFFCRYFDARPMIGQSGNRFTVADLRLAMKLHPWLGCIGGHAVKPTEDILRQMPGIRFFTFLRDPVERYYSHYRYWTRRLGRDLSLEDFLDKPLSWNFQTAKIAGSQDVELAKRILADHFLLAGLVEQFDLSLILLRRAIDFTDLDIRYDVANQGVVKPKDTVMLDRYRNRIADVNELDIELYAYVRDVLFARYREEYGSGLAGDLKDFRSRNLPGNGMSWRYLVDAAFRRCLINPLVGIIRLRHGLRASGSYGY